MKHLSITLTICTSAGSVLLQAQDGTAVRVEYEAVAISSDGAEMVESRGVHYISTDGRYRRDDTFAAGERTSLYRLPAEGVNVSVNHDLQVAVPSELDVPEWNARTTVRQVPPLLGGSSSGGSSSVDVAPPASTTPLGERTHGLIVLHGFEENLPDGGRAEHWLYIPPLMMQDPLAHPPVAIEMTAVANTGERYEMRVTSMRRIPIEADTFAVPYDGNDETAPDRRLPRRRPIP